MSSFHNVINEAKCNNLLHVIDNESLVFTFVDCSSEIWNIGFSNGIDVWKVQIDNADLKLRITEAQLTQETYLSRIRAGFTCGDLIITSKNATTTLHVGQGSQKLHFDLLKVIESSKEIQRLFLQFAKRCLDMEEKLQKSEQTLNRLRQESASVVLNVDKGSRSKKLKVHSPEKGMSTINPGSKKRKGASGVDFT